MKTFPTEYTAKNLTKNAGLVNLGKFADKIGLPGILEESLTIELGATADYEMSEIVMMLMMGVLAGAKHMSHPEVFWLGAVSRCEHFWQAV